jgi:hypothetical protein
MTVKSITASGVGLPWYGEQVWPTNVITDGFLARLWKNAYKHPEELDSGFQIDRASVVWIGRRLKEGHCIASSLPRGSRYKLWRYSALSSRIRHVPLQTRRLDAQLATSCQSTIISRVRPPQRSVNDGPQPCLVINLD